MAAIPSEVTGVIRRYIDIIKGDIAIDRVILFGSYAKGTYHKDSDIDLAIISPDYRDADFIDNMTKLLCKTSGLDADIQPVPFSVEDYQEPVGIMEEILRTGIELQIA